MASIAKTEDLAALDALNTAIEEVLSSERWEFDLRRDQMTLRPRLTGLVATNSAGDRSSFVLVRTDGLEGADIYGDYVTRLLVTGSADYANTADRVLYGSVLGGTAATIATAADLEEELTSATAELFYAEYILPDTVRDVVRVTHQEQPIHLEQIDPVIEFDELYPRPSLEYGEPQSISIGGLDVATYLGSGSAGAAGLRMVVWPVPDQAYVIDYAYYYRHPELTTATDTLTGVPQNVVAKIVETAAANMKAYYEKDYNALSLKADARRSLADMHRRSKGQSADRKIAGNWEGTGARHKQLGSLLGGRLVNGGV